MSVVDQAGGGLFDEVDLNRDGVIDREELDEYLQGDPAGLLDQDQDQDQDYKDSRDMSQMSQKMEECVETVASLARALLAIDCKSGRPCSQWPRELFGKN